MPDDLTPPGKLHDNPFVTPSSESGGARTISYERSPLVRLGMAGNRYARLSGRVFQDRAGLGVMDWRVLVALVHDPGATVAAITATIAIDKAAISRALARLQALGLVTAAASPGADARRKLWRLTEAGQAAHDAMLPVSLALHDRILDGFSQAEVATLNALLTRMIDNLDAAPARPQISKAHP